MSQVLFHHPSKPCNFRSLCEAQSAVHKAVLLYEQEYGILQQQSAKHTKRPSGYSGVGAVKPGKDDTKWSSYFSLDGQQVHLGTFCTKEEAAAAHDKAVRERGDRNKSCLNFPSETEAEAAVQVAQAMYQQTADVRKKSSNKRSSERRTDANKGGAGSPRKRSKNVSPEPRYCDSADTLTEGIHLALLFHSGARARISNRRIIRKLARRSVMACNEAYALLV